MPEPERILRQAKPRFAGCVFACRRFAHLQEFHRKAKTGQMKRLVAEAAPTFSGELARQLPIQPPDGGLALGVVALQLFVLRPPDRGDRLIFGGAA